MYAARILGDITAHKKCTRGPIVASAVSCVSHTPSPAALLTKYATSKCRDHRSLKSTESPSPARPLHPTRVSATRGESAVSSALRGHSVSPAAITTSTFTRDVFALADVVWMRQHLPGPTATERREHIRLCLAVGRFRTARTAIDALARAVGEDAQAVREDRARLAALLS